MKSPRALVFVVLGSVAAACGSHEDVTPLIAVQPGAAARAMALLSHGGPNDPSPPAAEDAGADAAVRETVVKGALVFTCVEARGANKALARVPCAVTIGGTSNGSRADGEIVAETGKVRAFLAPGAYRVTASRGLEYDRTSWDAEVRAGQTTWGPNEGATVLRRVVDTRGYLAADIHLEATAPDAGDEVDDDVLDDASDGVEIVVGGESFAGSARSAVQAAKIEDALAPIDLHAAAPALDALDAMDPFAGPSPFFARLLTKRPVTAAGSAPVRTYVRVENDGPLVTWSPAREADVVRGFHERRDVVLTTGPFLRVTANGAPIGGVARAGTDKTVEVKVHLECAPWVTVDTIAIARASGVAVDPRPVTLAPTPSGARAADVTFRLRATDDDAFIVTADARAAATDPKTAARAMTGAVWIDADGDGESLGRR